MKRTYEWLSQVSAGAALLLVAGALLLASPNMAWATVPGGCSNMPMCRIMGPPDDQRCDNGQPGKQCDPGQVNCTCKFTTGGDCVCDM